MKYYLFSTLFNVNSVKQLSSLRVHFFSTQRTKSWCLFIQFTHLPWWARMTILSLTWGQWMRPDSLTGRAIAHLQDPSAHVIKFLSQQYFKSLHFGASVNSPKWWMFTIPRCRVSFSSKQLWATLTYHMQWQKRSHPRAIPNIQKMT